VNIQSSLPPQYIFMKVFSTPVFFLRVTTMVLSYHQVINSLFIIFLPYQFYVTDDET